MADEKKPAPKKGKKLQVKKESIQELSDSQLDNVAGGDATGATAAPPSCADCLTHNTCRCSRPTRRVPGTCPPADDPIGGDN